MENFMLGGICRSEGYNECYAKGFKQGIIFWWTALEINHGDHTQPPKIKGINNKGINNNVIP